MSLDLVIEAHGLRKRFGRRLAVDGLDLAVPRGSVYGFLGPNGSGKTTTIRMLLGLLKPTGGTARLVGYDIRHHLIEGLRRTGAQVEAPAFCEYLTGRRNLQLLGAMRGPTQPKQIDEALERVRLTGRDNDKVRTYSHGMKARLALAQALLGRPQLVILDEPTNGLDPQGMREVRDLVRSMAEEDGITIFLSSHLLTEVQHVCDRVAIIAKGKLVREGAVSELLDSATTGRLTVSYGLPAPIEPTEVIAGLGDVEVLSAEPGRLRLKGGSDAAARCNAALVAAGVAVYELVPERQSLEDFFLDATGWETML